MLSKHAYKASEWEAKFVGVMWGVLSDVDYFYNLCAVLFVGIADPDLHV